MTAIKTFVPLRKPSYIAHSRGPCACLNETSQVRLIGLARNRESFCLLPIFEQCPNKVTFTLTVCGGPPAFSTTYNDPWVAVELHFQIG